MPRGVNLVMLLCFVIGVVLLSRLLAGAQTDDATASREGETAEQDGASGVGTVSKEEDPSSKLERLQSDANEAYRKYQEDLAKESQLNDKIVETHTDRTDAKEQLAEAEKQLGNRAAEVYKRGSGLTGLSGALTEANNLEEAVRVFDLWARPLDQDHKRVEELRKTKDTLAQQQEELKSQTEQRRQVLEEADAQKTVAEQARDEATELVDSLSAQEREYLLEKEAERNQDAAEAMQTLLDTREAEEQPPAEESGDETAAEQARPMTEEDQARQSVIADAIDQTLQELSAQGMLPKKQGADESAGNATGNEQAQSQNHLAERAAEVAKQQEQAAQSNRDAAEKVIAEQEADDKAAEQAQAAEDARRAAQQAPAAEQTKLQSTADEAQRHADQAAQDAAQKKLTAQEATDKAARDRAALPLVDPTIGAVIDSSTGTSASPTTGTPGSQPALSGSENPVIDYALNWDGVPYVFGGNSRRGIDCSAFTAAVFQKFGLILPDSPAQQLAMGTPVSGSELKPGDLVFFDEDGGGGPPTHVGIYMGNGRIVHASSFTGDVTETDMKYLKGFIGGRRLL
jgi:cell wall-associated NlpC family hydrolase